MNAIRPPLACFLFGMLLTASSRAQLAVSTEHVQLLVGSTPCNGTTQCERAPIDPSGGYQNFYGTDLGISYVHQGDLRWLFGDTWTLESQMCWDGAWGDNVSDDVMGWIDLSSRPDGDSVDAQGVPQLFMNPGGIRPYGPQGLTLIADGNVFLSGRPGLTPASGFSTGQDAWLMFRGENVTCNMFQGCPNGWACLTNNIYFTMPCMGTGCLCVDTDSPNYGGGSYAGAVAINMELAVPESEDFPEWHSVIDTWQTARLNAPATRTVRSFNPNSSTVADPRPASGVVTGNEKLLIWGRPGFGGAQFWGREAKLYLAYVDLASLVPAQGASFAPMYFRGLNSSNVPLWSANEANAQPLDLSGGADPTDERLDMTSWNTIAWVEPIGKWVMLYGGDLPDVLLVLTGGDRNQNPDGVGIYARYADQPWGPWSPPELVLEESELYAGNNAYGSEPLLWTNAGTGADTDPYRWKGVVLGPSSTCYQPGVPPWPDGLFCTTCEGCQDPCAGSGPPDIGRIYGPNIIEQWTEARPGNQADIYWNISTWNPYQVQLMKTRLRTP